MSGTMNVPHNRQVEIEEFFFKEKLRYPTNFY